MLRLLPAALSLISLGCQPATIITEGRPCERNDDCEEGSCVTGHGDTPICAASCADEDDCSPGLTCTLTHDVDGQTRQGCVPANDGAGAPGSICLTGDDCTTHLCHDSLCVELCTTCDAGEVCRPTTMLYDTEEIDVAVCEWRIDWSTLSLGAIDTPEAGSAEIRFDIPAGVASFTVVLTDDDDLQVAIKSLVAPDSTVLINIDDGLPDLSPAIALPGTVAAVIPSTDRPAARPQVGTYSMRVGTFDPNDFANLIPVAGSIERILVVPEYAGEEGGVLDLSIHAVPSVGLDPADAATNPWVEAMLGTLDALYFREAGVRVGDVGFHSIPEAYEEVDFAAIRTMLTEHSVPGPNGTSVNVFMVDNITFTSGFAGGSPGPPAVTNTSSSGVVIQPLANGNHTGILMAHEIGHYLGLRHTSELTGGGRDPIEDTPECAGGTAIVDCPDYDNMMFPMFPLDRPLILTPGQLVVLRTSPVLYETFRPNSCPEADATYDISAHGFGTGDTSTLSSVTAGACGGNLAPERWHLVRLPSDAEGTLEIRVTGLDFAPVVYARFADCADTTAEMACNSADAGTELLLELEHSTGGPWFIAVDGRDGESGTFVLDAVDVPIE